MSRRLPRTACLELARCHRRDAWHRRAPVRAWPRRDIGVEGISAGRGLLYWLAGGGVRVARERPMGDQRAAAPAMSHCLAPTVPDSRQGVLRRGRSLQDPGWRQAGSLRPYQAAAAHHRSQRDRLAQPEAAQSLEKPRPFPTEQKPGRAAGGRSARDMVMDGDMGAPGPRPAGEDICDEARGGPAAGRMTVTAP